MADMDAGRSAQPSPVASVGDSRLAFPPAAGRSKRRTIPWMPGGATVNRDWYIALRKYGSVPHGGFGMGIERCVAWLCGLEHIRETIAFPRMLYRLKP